MYRQTFSVTQATITTEIHKSLNIHGYLSAKVTFYLVGFINTISDLCNFWLSKVFRCRITINVTLGKYLSCCRVTDTVDVRQSYFNTFIFW